MSVRLSILLLLPVVSLILLTYRRGRALWAPAPLLLLTGGWLLSGWLLVLGEGSRTAAMDDAFADLVSEAQEAVERRMTTYIDALRSGASFMETSSEVSRADWTVFASTLNLQGRYPGINGVGVVFPVPRAETTAFERRVREAGSPAFTVRDVPVADTAPEPERAVITYIAPLTGNEAALGLDVTSEARRRQAALDARDTGEPRMTSRIRLVQDTGDQAGFLLFVPVYKPDLPLDTADHRRAAFRAWIYAPFFTERFLNGVLGARVARVHLDLFEGDSTARSALLYATSDQPEGSAFQRVTSLTMAGQRFTLGWQPGGDLPPTPPSPLTWVGLGCAMASVWLVSLIVNEQGLRERVQSLVAERTGLLRRSELRYRELVERLPEPTYVVRDGTFIYLNPAAVALLGATEAADLLGTPVLARIHHDHRHLALDGWRAVLAGDTVPLAEASLLRLDGTPLDVEVQSALIDYDGAAAIQVAIRDVTERKRAQRLVRETEARYQQLFEHMLSSLVVLEVICDAEGHPHDHRFLYGNPAFETQTGLKLADQVGRTGKDLGFSWTTHVAGRLYAVALGAEPFRYEPYDETLQRFFEVRAFSPTRGHVALSANDITDHKRAEAALGLRSAALDAAANAIVITNRDGIIEWTNRAFSTVTGYAFEEALGRTPGSLLKSGRHDREFYKRLWETILDGQVWRGEIVNTRRDGTQYPSEITITPVKRDDGEVRHFIAVEEDITQRRRLEEQFRQAQKMESIGRLAGGVAHDFNNMLGVIIGVADLVLAGLEPDSPLRADLQEIHDAARRSAELTRQLLTFARKQSVSPLVLDLNTAVQTSARMLQRLIGENIRLEWQPSPGVWPVYLDPSQLDQILANLCVNARDAIDDVGVITMATGNVVVSESLASHHVDAVPGDYVRLTVRDTGRGMPPEVVTHIFEPFFTTKGVGQGTGLGLSTVYGAIRQGGGFITVASTPGEGTVFEIYFPRHHRATEAAAATPAPATASGRETILLVEDEPLVLRMTERALTRQGYRVLSASSPAGALSVAQAHSGTIHLLLSDVVMPGMNGRDLAAEFRARYPDIKQLFMSGFPGGSAGGSTVETPGPLLAKPFTVTALAETVRRVLDAPD